jgi:hypothetical protein
VRGIGPSDPVFDAFGFALSARIVTLSGVYGADLAQTSAREEEDAFVVRAARLLFAAQQEPAPGALLLRAEREAHGRLRIRLRAKAREPVRAVALFWRGLAAPLEIEEDGGLRAVGPEGVQLAWPGGLALPRVAARSAGELIAVRCEDRRGRAKRFALALERSGERAGQGVLELLHEEDAGALARELEAPACVLARGEAAQRLLL